MQRRRSLKATKNPSALGWVGIGLGVTAGLGVALAGIVFYRMTRM